MINKKDYLKKVTRSSATVLTGLVLAGAVTTTATFMMTPQTVYAQETLFTEATFYKDIDTGVILDFVPERNASNEIPVRLLNMGYQFDKLEVKTHVFESGEKNSTYIVFLSQKFSSVPTPMPEPEIKDEVKPEAPKAEIKDEVKPEAPTAEIKDEVKPEAPTAEIKDEVKPEAPTAEIKDEVKPEAPTAEIKDEVKPEAPTAEIKDEVKPEAPKAEIKDEVKPEAPTAEI
ncbi:hypothetical protein ACVRWQ_03960, partial [Streptococcus phocae subsp. salmonis]